MKFSAGGRRSGRSLEFNTTSAAPTRLVSSVHRTNTAAGATITPAVRVTALDAFGSLATAFAGNVTVAIGTNAGGGALRGTVTGAAVAGGASFSDLSFNPPRVGFSLSAAAG